jgi:hydroxypyruvate isomerase
MNRRSFLGAAAMGPLAASTSLASAAPARTEARPFRLKYAPHFGMFRHHAGDDLVDQLQFMADEGFQALEDNGMAGRSVEDQERIAKAMERLGMTMGVFVAHADFGKPTFVLPPERARERIQQDIQRSIEVARRVNAKWCTVVPGTYLQNLEWDYQTANAIENLRFAASLCEPAGLVMVLEALNPWRDHPGLFLTRIPQAYALCRAVDSPSCKILDDLYHQQITEGNLIPNLDLAWKEIAYIQIGDNPGRCEPGTGEIHYRRIFGHLHAKGYEGVLGMEHGNALPGKEGERALIEAYRDADSF